MGNGSGQVGWCRAEHRSGSGSHVLARMTPCTVVVQISFRFAVSACCYGYYSGRG